MIKEKYIHHMLDTSINVINSKVESIRYKDITKTSIRLYKDGLIGVAGAIGEFNEDNLTKEAQEALNQKIAYPCEPSINFSKSIDMRKHILSGHHFLKEIETLLEELTQSQPDYIFSNKISLHSERHHIYNECGLNLEYSDKSFRMGLLFKAKTSANVFDGYFDFEERSYDRGKILEQMNHLLDAYKERVELPKKGKHPVVFFKSSFPAGKLISDLKGDVFASGSSLFSGKIGQKLFSENLSFYQTLDPEETYNTPFFDAEGTVNEHFKYHLIENGILKAAYSDKRTARKYGIPHTGSSVAPYDGVPTISFLNHSFNTSEKNIKELLGGQPGLFVLVADGGDFTPDGHFATPVQLAMLFDGERFLGRLPDFQISSYIFDMLGNDFRGMGKDSVFPFSTEKLVVADMMISEA